MLQGEVRTATVAAATRPAAAVTLAAAAADGAEVGQPVCPAPAWPVGRRARGGKVGRRPAAAAVRLPPGGWALKAHRVQRSRRQGQVPGLGNVRGLRQEGGRRARARADEAGGVCRERRHPAAAGEAGVRVRLARMRKAALAGQRGRRRGWSAGHVRAAAVAVGDVRAVLVAGGGGESSSSSSSSSSGAEAVEASDAVAVVTAAGVVGGAVCGAGNVRVPAKGGSTIEAGSG